jgi:hypothetical protein
MMIKIVAHLHVLQLGLHFKLSVLAFHTPTLRPALHPHVMTLAVILPAVTLEALTLDLNSRPSQEQLLLITTILALTLGSTGLT